LPSASESAQANGTRGSAGAEHPSIRVQGLSVTYRISLDRKPSLRGTVLRMGRREPRIREVDAVKDVSFEVPHGGVLGIVGANGAGKSTIMRTLAGILPPTSGRVEVDGRVSAVLALGVGFNRKLSGRQNVILGGLAAGLRRAEIEARYDDIVAFAEVGEFMDMPMRSFSSGMFGRLAFSVAVHMEPDILLIDEALSVGDARFKRKSARKMRELCAEARTIVLISHAMQSVTDLCDRVIWMDHGELRASGEPEAVIGAYTDSLGVDSQASVTREDL
jgi:ABC-type polysaccharide/polyol phosphate transport system ATPase subunit